MTFTSIAFMVFMPVVFLLYWLMRRSYRAQNVLLVAASYFFYGWFDWRYMGLLAGYTLCSYCSGLLLGRTRRTGVRKAILWTVVALNLGVLCIYKYLDFFTAKFIRLAAMFGLQPDWVTLDLVLPIGISFFTFQALSYTIDVYRRRMAPHRGVVSFFAFMSFFPQMVAGPIERADSLLPQFCRPRRFEYAEGVMGLRRILWGLFKKLVVADNCAVIVSSIMDVPDIRSWWEFPLGALLFTFQIYADFSGYCDIAIGCGRLLGIRLSENFRLPYFSRNIREFWQRWHITLQLWFRDYLYIPLGGSRRGLGRMLVNIMIVFGLSGLWHGAATSYVLWGLYNGALLVVFTLFRRWSKRQIPEVMPGEEAVANSSGNRFLTGLGIAATFSLCVGGWLLFRSQAMSQLTLMVSRTLTLAQGEPFTKAMGLIPCAIGIAILLTVEIATRNRGYALDFSGHGLMGRRAVRWSFYILLVCLLITMRGVPGNFIYFQF